MADTRFKKGQLPWNTGKEMSEEYRQRCRDEMSKRLMTGPPLHQGKLKNYCKRGHDRFSNGSVKGGPCRECQKIHYGANKEEILRRAKAKWNHEKIFRNAYNKERRWNRCGIVNKDGSPFSFNDYNRFYQVQGGKCKVCGSHQSALTKTLGGIPFSIMSDIFLIL